MLWLKRTHLRIWKFPCVKNNRGFIYFRRTAWGVPKGVGWLICEVVGSWELFLFPNLVSKKSDFGLLFFFGGGDCGPLDPKKFAMIYVGGTQPSLVGAWWL